MLTRPAGLVALALLAACGTTRPPQQAASPAASGVWYRAAPAGPAPPVRTAAANDAYFDDACADYLTDEAMFLRCQWVTGPDRAQYVPLVGQGAPLADRLRCHPLRDDPPGYRACLGRPS